MCSQSCWQYNSGVRKYENIGPRGDRPHSSWLRLTLCHRQKVVVPRAEHELSLKLLRLGQPRGARAPVGRWQVDGRSMAGRWRGSTRYTTRPVDARPTLGLHDLSMSADARSFYCASIYLSIYLSIYPSIHLSIYPSIHPSIYLSIYPSIHRSTSILPFMYPSIFYGLKSQIVC